MESYHDHTEPTPTSRSYREALRRELETGRRIPAYEMPSLSGLQYSARVSDLRYNVGGCVTPGAPSGKPDGLPYGLNVQNGPAADGIPGHTEFWLESGHWVKPPRIKGKAEKQVNRLIADAIDRDDWADVRRYSTAQNGSLFGDAAEVHRDDN